MTECVHHWLVSKPTAGYYVGAICKKCPAIKLFPADTDTRSGWRINRKRRSERKEK